MNDEKLMGVSLRNGQLESQKNEQVATQSCEVEGEEVRRAAGICVSIIEPSQETNLAPPHFALIIPAVIIHPHLRVREKLQKVENPSRDKGQGSMHNMGSVASIGYAAILRQRDP
jgi:hypothetical protein